MLDKGSFNVAVLCVCSVFFRELIYCLSSLMKNNMQIPLHIPLPHREVSLQEFLEKYNTCRKNSGLMVHIMCAPSMLTYPPGIEILSVD